jgi:alanine racemase
MPTVKSPSLCASDPDAHPTLAAPNRACPEPRSTARAWAEVSEGALAHNVALLSGRFGTHETRILAVVKADAYGHGIGLIAPRCYFGGIRCFGIATVEEGIALRALLPHDAAIYILAPMLPEDAPEIAASALTPLVSDPALGRALSQAALAAGISCSVHLDVDTGIGRAGVTLSEAAALLQILDDLPGIRVTGLSTHFASADEDAADARAQQAEFFHFVERLGPRRDALLIHASNSPAALILPDTRSHLLRPGLLLYGIEPAPGMLESAGLPLRPVLSVKARVLLARRLPPGATISYGKTYTVPPGGGLYATIGIGYGDGWPRRLAASGYVLLHGRLAPICGRICMDQLVVDVTHIPGVKAGNVATLLGRDGSETLTVGALAHRIDATPHEITTCLTARLPRIVVP